MHVLKTGENTPLEQKGEPIEQKGLPPRSESGASGLVPEAPPADNDVPENVGVASNNSEASTRTQEHPGSSGDVGKEPGPKRKFGLATATVTILSLAILGGFAYLFVFQRDDKTATPRRTEEPATAVRPEPAAPVEQSNPPFGTQRQAMPAPAPETGPAPGPAPAQQRNPPADSPTQAAPTGQENQLTARVPPLPRPQEATTEPPTPPPSRSDSEAPPGSSETPVVPSGGTAAPISPAQPSSPSVVEAPPQAGPAASGANNTEVSKPVDTPEGRQSSTLKDPE